MKQKLIMGWLALAGASGTMGSPLQFYVNDGVVSSTTNAPVIDAINFVNNNVFDVFTTAPYHTFDTINFTNKGFMTGNPGFDFQTYPSQSGQVGTASNFVNLVSGNNGGIIDCSGAFAFTTLINPLGGLFGSSRFTVRANNIINSGTINMGASSLLSLSGNNIDLTRGALLMTNLDTFGFFSAGILDGYWGVGTGTNPVTAGGFNSTIFAFTSPHVVTNRNGTSSYIELFEPAPQVFVEDNILGSNRTVRAIYFYDTNFLNTNITSRPFTNTAYFTPFELAVQWQWVSTNLLTHLPQTNFMYVTDDFQERTNLQLSVNGTTRVRNTYIPVNYRFFRGAAFTNTTPNATPASPGLPQGTFDNIQFTNQYAAYEALFAPYTQLPEDVAGGSVTNIAGRVEVTASSTLNLSRARISPLNYLLIKCTNHFLGSPNAQIAFPSADFFLATTNGRLTITNLAAPSLDRPEGVVDMWSARWTNVVGSITNNYHIWFVASYLAPTTPTREQSVNLRATNIFISDVLNVTSNLLLNVQRLTLTTNSPDSLNSVGELNLLSSDILWATATPVLKYLTNWGKIVTLNAVFFGGQRGSPFYNSNFNEPYIEFINHGIVTNSGSLIWATDFENSGTSTNTGIFYAGAAGSIQLQQAQTARLLAGAFYAPGGPITLGSGSLLISNHVLFADGALTLNVTNTLDDGSLATHTGGSLSNASFWTAGNGLNLLNRPSQGSLLSTFVTNNAPAFAEVVNQWSAADYGCSPSGYSTSAGNAPLGGLILDGGFDSLFTYIGTGPGANALYVDYLEFKDFTTNRDSGGNFIGVGIAPNMTIYFANAVANGVSIAEKLNGKFGADGASGGHFCWVSGYAGAFSSVTRTNLNDGTPYQVNAALATDCNLDTDGDGIANCNDPDPLHPPPGFAAAQLALSVTMTNSPVRAAVVSWNTTAGSTNFVYYKSAMGSTNWLLLTNFVSGSASRVKVLDPVSGAGRLYRVRLDASHL